MKKRFLDKVVIAGFVCGLLASQALAAGFIMTVNPGTLKNENNDTIADPASANFEIFQSVPAPNAAGSPVATNHVELSGGVHEYEEVTLDSKTIYVRIWSGTPLQEGSHYGVSGGYPTAATAEPPKPLTLSTLVTDHLASRPVNAPTITAVSESNQRIGETTDVILKLSVSYTYNAGTSPNIISATGYDVKYWVAPESEPSDSDTDRVVSVSGTSFSLPDKDPKTNLAFNSGTYYFRVRAKNWFGEGPWGEIKTWTTLSGGAGGAPVTLTLRKLEAGLGVNSLGIPFSAPMTLQGQGGSATVSTTSDLVSGINAVAGETVVTAVSYWDETTQKLQGQTYDSSGTVTFTSSGFDPAADLKAGHGYYVSVTKDVTLIISK